MCGKAAGGNPAANGPLLEKFDELHVDAEVRLKVAADECEHPTSDHQARWVLQHHAIGHGMLVPKAFADSDDYRLVKMVAPLIASGIQPGDDVHGPICRGWRRKRTVTGLLACTRMRSW